VRGWPPHPLRLRRRAESRAAPEGVIRPLTCG
jgi:hypothetical protein